MPSYLGIRRKRLDASLWKLFCFHLAFKKLLFIFVFRKEREEDFGLRNPSPRPSSGTWRGMWLVTSAVEEHSEGTAPFLN